MAEAMDVKEMGCVGCEEAGSWWFHLRRCTECGYIGCCDSSPRQHATHHARETGHKVICSFEPGESWCWNYELEDYEDPPSDEVATMAHPREQPVPGPADRVPDNWEAQLHQ